MIRVAAVGIVLAVALVTDIRKGAIPNMLTVPVILGGMVYNCLLLGVCGGIGQALLGMVVGVALFIVPFLMGGMGGGDVKLMAGVGSWYGPVGVINIGLYAALCGGGAAIFFLLAKKKSSAFKGMWLDFIEVMVFRMRPAGSARSTVFPYTMAIGAGFALYLCIGGVLK
ncbi:MAG: prepilin peptidase [Deltaproteobacteria bacterium]|nr:prepilin peptidase [Deltaproteobacteria bacterium]MBW1934840.1 prepilin peptidase [Deltaproteobacteria bacterium]MBW2102170.1 prepilin peptidase [Deltaproteobacteria bacterium]RLB38535.1 MAG: hypothetical protein DRH20_05520 [Deltaproteobacteria bacterium]